HHAVRVADIAVADDAQATCGQGNDLRIVREQAHDRFGKQHEDQADRAKENHVVEAGAPYRSLRPFGLLRAEILADERGGSIAKPPGRQNNENDDANRDGIASQSRRAKDADNAHKPDPTGMRDGELQDPGQRNADQAQQYGNIDVNVMSQYADSFGAAKEQVV